MAAASIILDNREHGLIALMPMRDVKQLPVGDAWIAIGDLENQTSGVVVERKTIADLESSLSDGRYREQRTRLLTFCVEKNARPLYILEGSLQNSFKKKVLWQVLTRLCLRYGVGLMQTASTKETAELLETIAHQITEDKECFKATTLSYSDVTSFIKKTNKDDPENFALAVLQQCSGVSADKAKALIAKFKSLEGVMAATEKDLESCVTPNGRKLGPVLAKRLSSSLHFSKE
jgi:ERCC4-type nuclease